MFESGRVGGMAPGVELGALLASAGLGGLDDSQTLAYLAACQRRAGWLEARRFDAMCRFADLNGWVPEVASPCATKLVHPGGDGTPGVDEFASDELAGIFGVSDYTAGRQLGAALDLRHRLPRTRRWWRAGWRGGGRR